MKKKVKVKCSISQGMNVGIGTKQLLIFNILIHLYWFGKETYRQYFYFCQAGIFGSKSGLSMQSASVSKDNSHLGRMVQFLY
jgi:hypothetical protein